MGLLTVTSPPAEAAVPLAQAKAFLRVGHDGEDEFVADLVQAATERLEKATGLALISRIMRLTITQWPVGLVAAGMRLSPQPVKALNSVSWFDTGDAVTDLSSQFELCEDRLCVRLHAALPAISNGARVEVNFECGFGGEAAVPADLKHAILRLCATAYSQGRGDGQADLRTELPYDVEQILQHYRRIRL